MRTILLAALSALFLLVGRSPAQPNNEPKPDLGRAAIDLGKQLGAKLVKQAPKGKGNKYRVAVFAFGNSEGKYPLEMGDNGPILRGALVDELRTYLDKNAPGKFTVLYPEQVDEEIKDSTADPRGISGKNLALARKLLKGYDFQVGIVGRFGIDKPGREVGVSDEHSFIAAQDDEGGVKITTTAILADVALSADTRIDGGNLADNGFVPPFLPPVKRMGATFFAKVDEKRADNDPRAWKAIPLQTSKDKSKQNLLYLVVPKEYEGKRYKVVLTNHGKPDYFMMPNRVRGADADRIFSATLLIDGVNSFMRYDGKQYRHVSGYPATLSKWIITPVGKRLVPDKAGIAKRVEGAKFASVEGPGGSQVHVLGFQKGRDVAGSFVFARAVDSVAAPELLALRKIGTISVYFYGEKLPNDEPVFKTRVGEAGTAMGKEVRSATFPVKVLNWYDDPAEVWHIIYRYEGDPILPKDLVPLK